MVNFSKILKSNRPSAYKMTDVWTVDTIIFKHPFTCLIAGPSFAGKSVLLEKILLNKETIIDKEFDRIVVCYKVYQPSYDVLKLLNSTVKFIEGLPNVSEFDKNENSLLILDDLMSECSDSQEISNFFRVYSHHLKISIFILNQNIFPKGKCQRDISLNVSYMIIFNNPRDRQQIKTLGQQMFPKKSTSFFAIFEDAISQVDGHGYLFIDFKQKTEERNRLQTGIIPGQERIIYKIK